MVEDTFVKSLQPQPYRLVKRYFTFTKMMGIVMDSGGLGLKKGIRKCERYTTREQAVRGRIMNCPYPCSYHCSCAVSIDLGITLMWSFVFRPSLHSSYVCIHINRRCIRQRTTWHSKKNSNSNMTCVIPSWNSRCCVIPTPPAHIMFRQNI